MNFGCSFFEQIVFFDKLTWKDCIYSVHEYLVILSIRNAIFGYQWPNYCLNQSWRSINDEFSSEYFKVVQCCYIETDKELAYSFVEFTYNGDLLLQSIYDDDNDRSTIPARCSYEANFIKLT